MNIYTVTYFRGNYGSALQAYALQQKLIELGANAKVIEPPVKNEQKQYIERVRAFLKPEKHYGVKGKIRRLIENRLFKAKNNKINSFVKQNIQTISYEDFCSQLDDDDVLLSGSDQIWSLIDGNIKDFYLFKSISNERVFRVSYAASIGVSDLTTKQIDYCRKALAEYDVVSLREKVAFNQLNGQLGETTVRQDVDPTLLYDSLFWRGLVGKRLTDKKYVFVYMLRPDKKLITMARKLAKENHQTVVYMGQFNNFYSRVKTITNAGIEEFLSAIYHADAIITNSFHGTVFSVMFEKKFVSVKIETTSSRVENLLSILKLDNHMIENESELEIVSEDIDYKKVKERLTDHRNLSLKYIASEICKQGYQMETGVEVTDE